MATYLEYSFLKESLSPLRRIGPDHSGHTLVRFPVQSGHTTGRQLLSNVLSFSLLYSVLKCDLNPSPALVIQGQVCHPEQSEGSFQEYDEQSIWELPIIVACKVAEYVTLNY